MWLGKTTRRLTVKPFSNEILEFKAVILRAGLYDLNAFDISYMNKGEQIEMSTPNEQTILCVLDVSVDQLDTFATNSFSERSWFNL